MIQSLGHFVKSPLFAGHAGRAGRRAALSAWCDLKRIFAKAECLAELRREGFLSSSQLEELDQLERHS